MLDTDEYVNENIVKRKWSENWIGNFDFDPCRYHNSRMINYDQGDGVSVEVTGVSNKSMKSILTLDNISMSAAGTYSCSPSMAR